MSEFRTDVLDILTVRIRQLVQSQFPSRFKLKLDKVSQAGCFVMWGAKETAELSSLHVAITNAVHDLVVPAQPIPAWVEALPKPQCDEKAAMLRNFGSPNVFSQYDAHVTLGFALDDAAIGVAHTQLEPAAAPEVWAVSVAISEVGEAGSVLCGTELLDVQLEL